MEITKDVAGILFESILVIGDLFASHKSCLLLSQWTLLLVD